MLIQRSKVVAFAALGLLLSMTPSRHARGAEPAENSDFSRFVEPFLARHCAMCHGGELMESDIRFDRLHADRAATDDRDLWQAVLEQLSLDTMPPDGEPRPKREDAENVIAWIRQTLEISDATPVLTQLPGFGNYVDHEALFTEPPVRKAASPPRVWRISPYIFREAVNNISGRKLLVVKKNQGGEGLHPAMPFTTPAHSFRDLSLPHSFEESTTELLVDMAWMVAGLQLEPKGSREAAALAAAKGLPSRPAFEEAVRYQFGLVLQRDPTDDELARLVELAERTERETSHREALQTVLAAVLIMPEAVYRFETGAGPRDEHGRARLTGREIAFSVSYALSDLPPDERLRAAAVDGRLDTRDGVRRQVERMLADRRNDNTRLLRFFQEYFEYTRCREVFKDLRIRKHYSPETLTQDADFLVLSILDQDRDVLARLLTTNEYFINYAGTDKPEMNRPDQRQKWYYELFNLPREWRWTADQPIALPDSERSGILTHPAWLISFSDNEKNQAIQRGLWIRTKLLGGTVPDVPIGVDAQLPTDESLTLREKMRVTRQEYCWRCHQRMDSLGLPFEQFDDFGIHRTEELGRPVDASGEIVAGVRELDGPISDPFEYLDRLARSRHVTQVFVRHAFRYWMGRNETLDDAPTLIDAERAYNEAGGSMRALVASLLTSDSFLYRWPTESQLADADGGQSDR